VRVAKRDEHRRGFAIGLFEAHSILQTTDNPIIEPASGTGCARTQRHVQIGGRYRFEVSRQNADHDVRSIAKRDGRSDRGRVSGEHSRPQPVAENDGIDSASAVVSLVERLAVDGVASEHGKEFLRHGHRFDVLGVIAGRQVESGESTPGGNGLHRSQVVAEEHVA
jgi:hypothetical protein